MNPLMVNRADGKRMVIDLDRVILFEEVNDETCTVWLETSESNIVHNLKVSLDDLIKSFADDPDDTADRNS